MPAGLVEALGHPMEGEVWDMDHMTEQEIIEIEQGHAMVPGG